MSNSFVIPWSAHGIFQERILERVAMSFSSRSSWPGNRTEEYCLTGRFFTAESSILGILKGNIHERIWNKRSISTWLWYFINNYCNDIYSLPPSSFSPWITFKTTEKIKLNDSRYLVNMYGIMFVKNLEILNNMNFYIIHVFNFSLIACCLGRK